MPWEKVKMKNVKTTALFIITTATTLFTACGKNETHTTVQSAAEQKQNSKYEGYYILPNGGYVDMYEDANGLVNVRSMRLIVVNGDGSTGYIPIASVSNMTAVKNAPYINSSLNFSLTNNVKNNADNMPISGSHAISLIFNKTNDALAINVIVSNASAVINTSQVVSQ